MKAIFACVIVVTALIFSFICLKMSVSSSMNLKKKLKKEENKISKKEIREKWEKSVRKGTIKIYSAKTYKDYYDSPDIAYARLTKSEVADLEKNGSKVELVSEGGIGSYYHVYHYRPHYEYKETEALDTVLNFETLYKMWLIDTNNDIKFYQDDIITYKDKYRILLTFKDYYKFYQLVHNYAKARAEKEKKDEISANTEKMLKEMLQVTQSQINDSQKEFDNGVESFKELVSKM